MAKIALDHDEVRRLLPHRYPFLMIDRVLEISETEIVAEKLVSGNEPFFQGHFPEKPIMPGVLIVEAMAQAAGIVVKKFIPEAKDAALIFAGINKARFRRPVVPGSLLTLHVQEKRRRATLLVVEGVARVDGETVAEAEFMAIFTPWSEVG